METIRFPIERGHAIQFARAVADVRLLDALVGPDPEPRVPPTFIEGAAQFAATPKFRPTPGERWLGSGAQPSGLTEAERPTGAGLHAEQRFVYHRPLRIGDELEITETGVREWEKQNSRGETLAFTEVTTEARDGSGELVLTAHRTIVRVHARPADGEAAS